MIKHRRRGKKEKKSPSRFENKKETNNEELISTMSTTGGIPIRRLVVNDPKDMPLHYGETPGGSIFSTTPGGRHSVFFL